MNEAEYLTKNYGDRRIMEPTVSTDNTVRDLHNSSYDTNAIAMLRNISKLPFFDKIGKAKSVGFRFYSAI